MWELALEELGGDQAECNVHSESPGGGSSFSHEFGHRPLQELSFLMFSVSLSILSTSLPNLVPQPLRNFLVKC